MCACVSRLSALITGIVMRQCPNLLAGWLDRAAFADPNRISIINEPRAAKRLTTRGPNPEASCLLPASPVWNLSPAVHITCRGSRRARITYSTYSWQGQSIQFCSKKPVKKEERWAGKFSQAFSLMITCSFSSFLLAITCKFYWTSQRRAMTSPSWKCRNGNCFHVLPDSTPTAAPSHSLSLSGQAVCQGHNEQNFRYFRAIRRKTHRDRGRGQLGVLCKWLLWSQMLMRQRLLCRHPEKGCSCHRGWIERTNSE